MAVLSDTGLREHQPLIECECCDNSWEGRVWLRSRGAVVCSWACAVHLSMGIPHR